MMVVGGTKFLFLPRKSHVEISKSLRCRIYTIVIVIYRLEVEVRACSQHPFAQIKCRNEAVFWANFGDTSHKHFNLRTKSMYFKKIIPFPPKMFLFYFTSYWVEFCDAISTLTITFFFKKCPFKDLFIFLRKLSTLQWNHA